MALVTVGGIGLAILHNAMAISLLAVLGGFLTPILLRTGRDPRDALFSYLLLLDLGVLGVVYFKRWRVLEMLAFAGTWIYFTGWYLQYYTPLAAKPATLWVCAFYLVFLLSPYAYHIRKLTPITGERFFSAVSNAVITFGYAFAILHGAHKHWLGAVTLGMSGSYLVLGSLTRRRIPQDAKAVFAFIAMSVTFLTIAVPILLKFDGVTVAWAAEAPLLLYLAYKYPYFPVRLGCLIPLFLAAVRIFSVSWPLHEEKFFPIFNRHFGTAIFVAFAGWAYAVIHHANRKLCSVADRVLKIGTGVSAGFLALILLHAEVWQWLDLSGRAECVRWASALVWAVGACGFLLAGMKLRSVEARVSGLAALFVPLVLEVWDYSLGARMNYPVFLNGRFLSALAGILTLLSYSLVYRRCLKICTPREKVASAFLWSIGIFFLLLLFSFETYQSLDVRGHYYAATCLLPLIWAGGAVLYLTEGIRLRSYHLRCMGLVVLASAGILAAYGYLPDLPWHYRLYANWRFVAALAVLASAFGYAAGLRHFKEILKPQERSRGIALHAIAILLLLILINVETNLWLDVHNFNYAARCVLPIICGAGALIYLFSGFTLKSSPVRALGIAALIPAAILVISGYSQSIGKSYLLYLNWRFVSALIPVLASFYFAYYIRRRKDVCGNAEQKTASALNGFTIALLLLLLSAETYLYCISVITDPQRAHWAAQMSLPFSGASMQPRCL
jgi:hypothetical protein